MNLFVLDTDILVLFQEGHEKVRQNVFSHFMDELRLSVITVEEQLSGWYTLLRKVKKPQQLANAYQRLADTVVLLSKFRILSFTESAIERFEQLKQLKLGVKHMDLRIAAITLDAGATLVTRNLKDFKSVPNLTIENWAD